MTLKQAKRLVNPTLQVITSRKDKNMPKTKQAKGKARWIGEWCLNGGHDPNNPWPLGSLPARPITKLVEISSKLVVKPPKQEWENRFNQLVSYGWGNLLRQMGEKQFTKEIKEMETSLYFSKYLKLKSKNEIFSDFDKVIKKIGKSKLPDWDKM